MKWSLVLVVLCLLVQFLAISSLECTSEIYCRGPLLNAVQMAQVFNDSKYFVDMSLRYSPETVLAKFNKLPSNATKEDLSIFVAENFYPVELDLTVLVPPDWQQSPPFLLNIENPVLREWASGINQRWLNLSRQFNHSFSCPDCYSSLNVSYPFIIAGGRFREFYYWDSYWIVKGLLVSGMYTSSWQMLQNLLSLVELYGFVPNGGRIYYLDRSQPPLLTQMAFEHWKVTNNISFLQEALPILDQEYEFWMNNHTVNLTKDGTDYQLNIYHSHNHLPRPESYYNDVTMLKGQNLTDQQRGEVYSQIASGCESGWDFSSRWLKQIYNLSTIQTKNLVPVDLNSILYKNEIVLASFHGLFNNREKEQYYLEQAKQRVKAIHKFLWDEQETRWYDYDWVNHRIHKVRNGSEGFYASSLTPLWAQAYSSDDGFNATTLANVVLGVKKILTGFPAGVPTSLLYSGEQWDLPNAWSPLMYFIIEGVINVARLGGEESQELENITIELISKWIKTNYCGWNKTSEDYMYEKYDVGYVGGAGFGGQYPVQNGFGWTNGVALYLLNTFGSKFDLTEDECANKYEFMS